MKHHLILVLALGFMACMNQESATGPSPAQPNETLQLVAMSGLGSGGLNKISIQSSSSYTYSFNLDTAKNSIQEYFVIQNTGNYDIDNITLTTNNSQIYFSPSVIPVLHPSNNSSILQVITLNVVHGTRLNGVGVDSLLPMGTNTAIAQLTASTTDAHGDSLKISQNAIMTVFAELMDLNLYDSSSTTPATQFGYDNFGDPTFFGSGTVRNYELSGTVRAVNTGNVNITISDWASPFATAPTDSVILKPSGTAYFPAGTLLQLNAQGTISIPGKFATVDNGMIVFGI